MFRWARKAKNHMERNQKREKKIPKACLRSELKHIYLPYESGSLMLHARAGRVSLP
jgi:hypothetical protein